MFTKDAWICFWQFRNFVHCPIISGRWYKMKKINFCFKKKFGTQKILDVQKDLGEKISRMLESISGSFEFHAALEYSLPAQEFWALWENSDARKFWSQIWEFYAARKFRAPDKGLWKFSLFFPKHFWALWKKPAWHSRKIRAVCKLHSAQ